MAAPLYFFLNAFRLTFAYYTIFLFIFCLSFFYYHIIFCTKSCFGVAVVFSHTLRSAWHICWMQKKVLAVISVCVLIVLSKQIQYGFSLPGATSSQH